MAQDYVPIDFVDGRFMLASNSFAGFQRRELVRMIRGCGGVVYLGNNIPGELTNILYSRDHELVWYDESATLSSEADIVASSGLGLPKNARMGMLRGALQGEPSRAAWNHIVALLEAWPHDQGVEDAVRYVADLSKAWPARTRTATARWVKRAVSGVSYKLELAGSITLRNGQVAPKHLPLVFEAAQGFEHVTFGIRGTHSLPLEEVAAALRMADLYGVRSMRFDHALTYTHGLADMVVARCEPTLEVLELLAVRAWRGGAVELWWPLSPEQLAALSKRCPRLEIRLLDPMGEVMRVRKDGKEAAR